MRRLLMIAVTVAGCAHAKPEPLDPPAVRHVASPPVLRGFEQAVQAKGDTSQMSPLAARLADLDSFTAGGDFGGQMQEPERLTIELAREPDALKMFAALAVSPNRVARLYAYWALRTLDRPGADQLRAELVIDHTKVETTFGCIGMIKTTSQLAVEIDSWPPPGTGYQVTPTVTP